MAAVAMTAEGLSRQLPLNISPCTDHMVSMTSSLVIMTKPWAPVMRCKHHSACTIIRIILECSQYSWILWISDEIFLSQVNMFTQLTNTQ